jgi:hypothetical protein
MPNRRAADVRRHGSRLHMIEGCLDKTEEAGSTMMLNDLARFHIEALFFGLAHREGFARQSPVQDNRLE